MPIEIRIPLSVADYFFENIFEKVIHISLSRYLLHAPQHHLQEIPPFLLLQGPPKLNPASHLYNLVGNKAKVTHVPSDVQHPLEEMIRNKLTDNPVQHVSANPQVG